MTYAISPNGRLREEVARVAGEQLHDAVGALERHTEGVHHAVHQARKAFKRLRGLYRLVKAGDREFQRRENIRIRDTARTLSAARDAAAVVETLAYLASTGLSETEAALLARVEERLKQRRDAIVRRERDLPERIAAAIAACGHAVAALDDLSIPNSPKTAAAILGKGWRRTCHGAQAAIAECRAKPHQAKAHQGLDERARADAFHDLRKRTQDHWMHARLLRDLWPSVMHERRDQAKRLVDILGHACDLSVLLELKDRAPDEVGDPADLAALEALVVPRMEALRAKAVERGEELFAEPPDFAGQRIRLLWRHDAA